ncbi:hypothetical protein FHW37_102386 [Neorhizobium alkalisoli]|uniref:Uncharacterized protein n=1 Tax=Neorhizobium alkalisoli TaxID=528178 RepID=A0A561R2A6_9HYPH|nr:hypothetical protein FHW37_102386 [Neorhizobium alkalisoli]
MNTLQIASMLLMPVSGLAFALVALYIVNRKFGHDHRD